MRKKRIRRLFIVVMIILPLQYAVVGIVGYVDAEPWPAFVFPGFKSVPVADGAFTTEQKVFEIAPDAERGDPIQIAPGDLFPAIPVSQLSGFLRENFSANRDFESLTPEASRWLLNQAEGIVSLDVKKISLLTVLEYRRFNNGTMSLDSSVVVQSQTVVWEGM